MFRLDYIHLVHAIISCQCSWFNGPYFEATDVSGIFIDPVFRFLLYHVGTRGRWRIMVIMWFLRDFEIKLLIMRLDFEKDDRLPCFTTS